MDYRHGWNFVKTYIQKNISKLNSATVNDQCAKSALEGVLECMELYEESYPKSESSVHYRHPDFNNGKFGDH